MDRKINILLLVNSLKDKDFSISCDVTSYLLNEVGRDITIYTLADNVSKVPGCFVYNNQKVDFALVLGGDGTLLNYAQRFRDSDFPFFGINLGRVGCLTEATIDNFKDKLLQIINGNYFIEERNTITCEILKNNKEVIKNLAFNEVSLQRGRLFKMLLINMFVNNNNKTSFYADGLVVATPTGSSAFSLSCGGPLLLPTAKNYVITPINPQLRTITSLVVNDTDIISIDICERNIRELFDLEKPIVVIDGAKMVEIDRDDKINLYKSDKKLKIIKVDGEASLFEPTLKVAMSSQNISKQED